MTPNAVYMQGFVESASQTGPAPASAIRYNVAINYPNGTTGTLQGVRPRGSSITDYYPDIDVMALRPGHPVSIVMIAGEYIVFASPEVPKVVDCSGNPLVAPVLIEDATLPGTFTIAPTGTTGTSGVSVGGFGIGGIVSSDVNPGNVSGV